eukprot:1576750-Rhodomonas_salina.1
MQRSVQKSSGVSGVRGVPVRSTSQSSPPGFPSFPVTGKTEGDERKEERAGRREEGKVRMGEQEAKMRELRHKSES